jgi:hypothetical protein
LSLVSDLLILQRFQFIKTQKMDKNLMANATSSDDAPTPGYMLSEIASKQL